jgi:hypothetical protein
MTVAAFAVALLSAPLKCWAADDTGTMTPTERAAVGDYVHQCVGNLTSIAKHKPILITVVTDDNGIVRNAFISPINALTSPSVDASALNADPALRQLAERAIAALMSPKCARLPLSQSMLGHWRVLTFRFAP